MTKKQLESILHNIQQGLFNGLGFSIGATIGFAIVSTLIVQIIQAAGGLPLVGNFFAMIVKSTQEALTSRTH